MKNQQYRSSSGGKGLRGLLNVLTICVMAYLGVFLFLGAKSIPIPQSPEFEKAVSIIKKYEGMHYNKGNLVGYGHKILKGEGLKRNQRLSEAEADKLLRKDLALLCQKYRGFGKDSLLLSALAYNCGIGVVAKSNVYKRLKTGNRDIKDSYLAHCRYRGKVMSQIKRRRVEEFQELFIKD